MMLQINSFLTRAAIEDEASAAGGLLIEEKKSNLSFSQVHCQVFKPPSKSTLGGHYFPEKGDKQIFSRVIMTEPLLRTGYV